MKRSLYISSIAGIRKANVFPDPVFAAPTKSRPSKSGGTDLACISVNVVKPISAIPFNVSSHTFSLSDSKVQLLRISRVTEEPGTKNSYN